MIVNSGIQALTSIFVHLCFLALAWWALQSVRFSTLLQHPKSLQSRILYLMLAIAISYPVARFFLDYAQWSLMLPQMYE